MCHCHVCQKQTGSAFGIQARFPRKQVTIEGKSTTWKFPVEGATPVPYRNCDSEGVTFHVCPVCGSTVYYEMDPAPDFIGVKVGAFAGLPMPGGHHD